MSKFKLYAHEPHAGDSTSFHRGSGVLGALEKSTEWLNIQWVHDYHEFYSYISDGLFIQRPFMAEHLHAMNLAKAAGNKTWCDFDDNLLSVNSENPAYSFYERQEIKDNIKKIWTAADFITVTTEDLASAVKEYNDNVFIVPNAINDRFLRQHKNVDYKKQREKKIYWRGGSSHERDLRFFSDIIVDAVKKFPEWKWDFVGAKFWFLTDELKDNERVKFTEWKNFTDYYSHLIKEENSLCVIPLADNVFNHSKSNLAWLEASYFGTASICPNWESWKVPGAISYSDRDSFKESLFNVMSDNTNTDGLAETSWDHIKENLLLSNVNKLRLEIMEKMRG